MTWQWTPRNQLRNMLSSKCLTAPQLRVDFREVYIGTCEENDLNQVWNWKEFLLRPLGSKNFNLHFAKTGQSVVLFNGVGAFSRWEPRPNGSDICENWEGIK